MGKGQCGNYGVWKPGSELRCKLMLPVGYNGTLSDFYVSLDPTDRPRTSSEWLCSACNHRLSSIARKVHPGQGVSARPRGSPGKPVESPGLHRHKVMLAADGQAVAQPHRTTDQHPEEHKPAQGGQQMPVAGSPMQVDQGLARCVAIRAAVLASTALYCLQLACKSTILVVGSAVHVCLQHMTSAAVLVS
jgi:hypothetical protein